MPMRRAIRLTLLTVVAFVCAIGLRSVRALDHVLVRREGRETRVTGKILVTAQDNGLLLATADGTLWNIQPEEIVRQEKDDAEFKPLTQAELAKEVLKTLPAGFEVHFTKHYVICHNTSKTYAQWVGTLYERLYAAFTGFWTKKGFKLREPEFPLAAIVFADQEAYAKYAASELGEAAGSIVGYYSLRTNRVMMHDLTGLAGLRRPGDRRGTGVQISTILSRPEAEQNVATIVHEATHQIAYNCGLNGRYADVPVWVSEGIAMYFETPDVNNAKGWQKIGAVSQSRLAGFREKLPDRKADSLSSLISSDKRFRDTETGPAAYAEAWALTYFLLRRYPDKYTAYMKTLSEKKQFYWNTPEDRLKEFRSAFGEDLKRLDGEFLRTMGRVR